MKDNSTHPNDLPRPAEEDIREYAYHLYQQSGCAAGHDLDNWLEATACLKANIPIHRSGVRLHQHIYGPEVSDRYRLAGSLGS